MLPGDSTEDWLTKNFGSFSILAQLQEFSSVNALFNGVLNVKINLHFYPKHFLVYTRYTVGQGVM